MIGSKIALLEEITGCKLVCPRGVLADLDYQVQDPPLSLSLSMLRYGIAQDNCDLSVSQSTKSTIQEKNSMELTGLRPPSNSNSNSSSSSSSYPLSPKESSQILQAIKVKAGTPNTRDLCVRKNPSAVFTHAVVRLAHSLYVEKLYNMSTSTGTGTMQTATEQSKCSEGTLPVADSSTTNLHNEVLYDLALLTEKTQRITGQCGVLCGLWVMALSLDPKRRLQLSESESDLGLPTDTAELDRIVDLVENSPFKLERLMDAEHVACVTLLDIFATLAMPLGPNICKRAAAHLLDMTLGTKVSCHEVPVTCDGAVRAVSVEAKRMRADRVVLGALQVCAEEDSSSCSSDTSPLTFDIGSDGVIECPRIVSAGDNAGLQSETDTKARSISGTAGQTVSLCIYEMKAAVFRGCSALLSAMQHEDLQVALSLPITACDVYRERMESEAMYRTLEERAAEISVALELCEISSHRMTQEYTPLRKDSCCEASTYWCSLLQDRHYLDSNEGVAVL